MPAESPPCNSTNTKLLQHKFPASRPLPAKFKRMASYQYTKKSSRLGVGISRRSWHARLQPVSAQQPEFKNMCPGCILESPKFSGCENASSSRFDALGAESSTSDRGCRIANASSRLSPSSVLHSDGCSKFVLCSDHCCRSFLARQLCRHISA